MWTDPNHLREALLESVRWLSADLDSALIFLEGREEVEGDVPWVVLDVSTSGPPMDDSVLAGAFEIFAQGGQRGGPDRHGSQGNQVQPHRSSQAARHQPHHALAQDARVRPLTGPMTQGMGRSR